MVDRKYWKWGAGATLVVLFSVGGYHIIPRSQTYTFDATALEALGYLSQALGYTITVDTATLFPDKSMNIQGHYTLAHSQREFYSESTTTIYAVGDDEGHSFSLKNMVIPGHIYTAIESSDPLFEKTLPLTQGWRHFLPGAIPPEFATIAVYGPVTDPLALFRDSAALLSPQEAPSTSDLFGGTVAYRTNLRKNGALSAPVGTLYGRLGDEGTVTLYIDSASTPPLLRGLVFNGESYHATTTILSFEDPPPLTAPLSTLSPE